MKIALDEVCRCGRQRPGYPQLGKRTCIFCRGFIVSRLRLKRLELARKLRIKRENRARRGKDKVVRHSPRKRANGIPTSARSQQG